MFDPTIPYNHLPELPPKENVETPEILKACIKANRELAKLKIAEKILPNQNVLIHTIPLLESQSSSAIENIVTTTDELFEYSEKPFNSSNPAIKETLRYREALYKGFQSLQKRPLSISQICEICSIVRGVETEVRKTPGTTLINDLNKKTIYTPPQGPDTLQKLLTNWQNYLHEKNDIDPLIKLAVQHYQFEAIHPFTDGNGRTGRIINLLYLIEQGLLDTPILYLSSYLINHKAEYYENLLGVTTHKAWAKWIIYFLKGIEETSIWAVQKIISIEKLMKESSDFIKLHAPQIHSKELVELLFVQPYIRIFNLTEVSIAKRDTAAKYLRTLCAIGFLEENSQHKEKLFINHQFLALLKQK